MKSIDPGDINRIKAALDAAISRNPELGKYQQQTRAAFTVATALAELAEHSQTTTNDLATRTGISESQIEAIYSAMAEKEPCAQLIAKLAEGMGYQFELQLFPEDRLSETRRRDDRLSGDGKLGGVVIRLPFTTSHYAFGSAIADALKRLKLKLEVQASPAYSAELPHQEPKLNLIDDFLQSSQNRQLSIADLLSLADAINYKIQLRFVPRSIAENPHLQIASQSQRKEDPSRARPNTYTTLLG